MSVPAPMGAHVEIVEPYTSLMPNSSVETQAKHLAELPCIRPRRVRINGTDVGIVKRDSIIVDIGDDYADAGNRPASVTLTLLVKSVEIKAE